MGNRLPAMSRATLYVIPVSHPAMAARRMLEHKGSTTSASTSCRRHRGVLKVCASRASRSRLFASTAGVSRLARDLEGARRSSPIRSVSLRSCARVQVEDARAVG